MANPIATGKLLFCNLNYNHRIRLSLRTSALHQNKILQLFWSIRGRRQCCCIIRCPSETDMRLEYRSDTGVFCATPFDNWNRCYARRRFRSIRSFHDDVIKSKHFPRLMFSLICVWINGWVNNRETGDFRGYRTHYEVTVMRRDYILYCNSPQIYT